MSSGDALLGGMDAITQQTHAARPREALTGGKIPIRVSRRYFHLDRNFQLAPGGACRAGEHRGLSLAIRTLTARAAQPSLCRGNPKLLTNSLLFPFPSQAPNKKLLFGGVG